MAVAARLAGVPLEEFAHPLMLRLRSQRSSRAPGSRSVLGSASRLVLSLAAPLAVIAVLALAGSGVEARDEVPFPGDEDLLVDTDKDGLADLYEYALGTDTHAADSDRDGYADGAEVAHRSNPLIPSTVLPDGSAVRLDFLPEAGGIRVAITVLSRNGFGDHALLHVLLGTGDETSTRVRSVNSVMMRLGCRFASEDGVILGYVSRRLPLRDMPARFSLGALLENGEEFVIDDALVGVRGGQFFRTELTALPNDLWLGGTLFVMVDVQTGGQPGFSPNEDCKQIFGRVSGSVKLILREFCEDALDRYCPDNCGSDVGLRVVCIRELFGR